ncbi:MAG TPA: hypothetical protein VIK60_00940 [Vicinamibacterales bacterium]
MRGGTRFAVQFARASSIVLKSFAGSRGGFSRRRWVIVFVVCGVLVAMALAWLVARVPFSSEILRSRVITTLRERLNADVELGAVTLRVLPRFEVRGNDLVVRYQGRRDVPPLFRVEAFTVNADVMGLWRRHVAYVKLEGLEIQIPPREEDDAVGADPNRAPPSGPHVMEGRQVVVDLLDAPGAKLVILPRQKEKPPKTWYMYDLRVESVSANTAMPFKALLTNALPPGEIATEGSVGPWHRDDPGHTPVFGQFTFKDADLGVFKGIDGTLSAAGSYGGSLDRIEVRGETDTPDFMVNISGQPVALKTSYHAIVDGTNGDTRLEEIKASFINTSLTARGGVFDVQGVKGRLVTLDITIDEGRLEDVMRLAVKTPKPPMTGTLHMTTSFNLPPGDEDVVDKLALNGRFVIERGGFTHPEVQQRIDTLSQRASGRPRAAIERSVASTFAGRFVLDKSVLALPAVSFDVPGAVVELKGQYALRRETVAFAGELVMDAKLSQTATGFKSFLLRAVDPLFRRGGRTVVPIRITGTRNEPSFGLDVKRVFTRRDVAGAN